MGIGDWGFYIILNFFRAYQTSDENLIRQTKFIFVHYIQTWFIFDFIQCIPYFTLFKYLEGSFKSNCSFDEYENNKINRMLYLLILLKIIKLYKMLTENITILQ